MDYGLSAQFVQAGYIYGTQIIGGDIYSDNYSPTSGTYINLRDGSFSFAGGKLKYDGSNLSLNGDITANTLNATNSGKISCWNFNNNALYRGKDVWGDIDSFYFGIEGISIGKQFTVDSFGQVYAKSFSCQDKINIYSSFFKGNYTFINETTPGSNDDWIAENWHIDLCFPKYNEATGLHIKNSPWIKYYYTLDMSGDNITGINAYMNWQFHDDVYIQKTFYTSSGTVSKSDKENKNSITPLSKIDSANFIYSLNPTQYKLNDGTSNRYHHGFLAQEVKEAMGTKDWGLYIDTAITNDTSEKEKNSFKALRYEELIADLVATVQSQNERISLLEQELIER